MKTIIVTGVCGFIGGHLADFFLKQGNIVYGIDKISYASNNHYKSLIEKRLDTFTFKQIDINDLDYLPQADFLIHAAAESHVDNSIANQDAFMCSNILGTEHLLSLVKAMRPEDRPVFIQISTDEVYSDNPPTGGYTESAVLNPSSPYSASKAAADQLVIGYAKTFDLKYIIIRPTNNYGIRQYPEKLIPKNLRALARGNKMTIYGAGTNKRTFLHVNDTVGAIGALIRSFDYLTEDQILNQTFNISGDVILQNREVLYHLACIYFKKPKMSEEEFLDYIKVVDNRKSEDKIYKIDDSKFRNLTGWTPKCNNFRRELKKIIEYHRKTIELWV